MKYKILHICQTIKTSLILILLKVLKALKTIFNDSLLFETNIYLDISNNDEYTRNWRYWVYRNRSG